MKTLALVSLILFTACIDQTDPDVSATEQDVANCTGTYTLGGTDYYLALGAAGTTVSITTDDLSSYNTGVCFPNSYVTQIDFTLHRSLSPFVHYAGPLPTNSTSCTRTYVDGEVWGRIGSSWQLVGQVGGSNGVWIQRPFQRCLVPSLDFPEITNSKFDEVTIVGEAVYNGGTLVNVTDGATAH